MNSESIFKGSMLKISFTLYIIFCPLSYRQFETQSTNKNNHPQIADTVSKTNKPDLQNPALMYGSTLGEIVQQFYKQGRWSELMKFISISSIDHFGKEAIIQSFKKTDFGYDIRLKSMIRLPSGKIQMNYQTVKFGTTGVLRMEVKIENDTAKIIIREIHPYILF